jgi:hypothetical protein
MTKTETAQKPESKSQAKANIRVLLTLKGASNAKQYCQPQFFIKNNQGAWPESPSGQGSSSSACL